MPDKDPQQLLKAYNKLIEEMETLAASSSDVMKYQGLKLMADGTLEALRKAIEEYAETSGEQVACEASDGRCYYTYRKTFITYDPDKIKAERPDLYERALDFSINKAKEIPGLNIYAQTGSKVVVSSRLLKDDQPERPGAGKNN